VTSGEAASFAAQIGALGSIAVSSRDDIRGTRVCVIPLCIFRLCS
jgi:hypothetical protein